MCRGVYFSKSSLSLVEDPDAVGDGRVGVRVIKVI